MKHTLSFLVVSLLGFASMAKATDAELMANVARVDLTPPLDMKYSLGGYGARMSKPAEGIHDRIWAKALVLSDGQKKFALVTLDILALPPNVKPLVLEQLAPEGWTPKNVMFLPSHSHTSLDMSALNDKNILNNPAIGIYQPQLLKLVVDSLVAVVKRAGSGLQPVAVGTGRATLTGMNRNRRRDPAVDTDLTVTRVDLKNGNPLAVLVNWTAHPTLMGARDMWISGGWPGYMQRELEAWIGNGVISMYYNGAEGDQSPVAANAGSHYEQAEIYGREIALRAFEVYRRLEPKSKPVFDFNYRDIQLPDRQAHPMFKTTGGTEYGINDKGMEIILQVMCPELAGVGAVRIGDLLIAGAPGELTSELGLQVKNKLHDSGVPYAVIGGLANEWISYIMSAQQYQRGGYEASVSFYGPDLGKTIVEGMLGAALPLAE